MTLPLKTDAEGLFAADDFVEWVEYLPREGRARTIRAVVERSPPEPLDGAPGGVKPSMVLVVLNDEQAGVGSREVDTGGDRVRVPSRIGRAAEEHRILDVAQNDEGTLELKVQ